MHTAVGTCNGRVVVSSVAGTWRCDGVMYSAHVNGSRRDARRVARSTGCSRRVHEDALILLVVATTLSGCYLGRSRSAKVAGFVANGVLVAGGALALQRAEDHPRDCTNNGPEPAFCDRGTALPKTAMVLGAIGLLINLVVPMKTNEVAPQQPARPATLQAALVHARL